MKSQVNSVKCFIVILGRNTNTRRQYVVADIDLLNSNYDSLTDTEANVCMRTMKNVQMYKFVKISIYGYVCMSMYAYVCMSMLILLLMIYCLMPMYMYLST